MLNVANALTVGRLLMVPLFVWLMLQPGDALRLVAAIVFVVAAATDQLDGHLARSWGLVTSFGKIADPIADKVLTLSAFVLLSVAGILWWWVTIVIMVRELGITLLRFVMLRRAVVMPASQGGKLKTVLQMSGLVLLLVPWQMLLGELAADIARALGYASIGAALVVTVVTGADYVLKAARIARQGR